MSSCFWGGFTVEHGKLIRPTGQTQLSAWINNRHNASWIRHVHWQLFMFLVTLIEHGVWCTE